MRELHEELNLAPADIESIRCIGMAEDGLIAHPELIFHIRAQLTREQIEQQLHAMSTAAASRSNRGASPSSVRWPSRASSRRSPIATLLLFGNDVFGGDWFRRAALSVSACVLRFDAILAALDPIIDISQLDFAYGEQLALKQIDLRVEPRTTVGLIGPNGAGKSTLIKLLLGLLKPTRGSIRIDGLSPGAAIARGNVVGYLPQNPQLASHIPLTVRQAVRLGLVGKTGMLRSHAREDLAFVDQLLDRIGIADQAEQSIGELSGGQIQRMLIARALAPRQNSCCSTSRPPESIVLASSGSSICSAG